MLKSALLASSSLLFIFVFTLSCIGKFVIAFMVYKNDDASLAGQPWTFMSPQPYDGGPAHAVVFHCVLLGMSNPHLNFTHSVCLRLNIVCNSVAFHDLRIKLILFVLLIYQHRSVCICSIGVLHAIGAVEGPRRAFAPMHLESRSKLCLM